LTNIWNSTWSLLFPTLTSATSLQKRKKKQLIGLCRQVGRNRRRLRSSTTQSMHQIVNPMDQESHRSFKNFQYLNKLIGLIPGGQWYDQYFRRFCAKLLASYLKTNVMIVFFLHKWLYFESKLPIFRTIFNPFFSAKIYIFKKT
jgi:hypothetical protein